MKNLICLLIVTVTFPFLNSCTIQDENLVWGDYSLNAEKQSEIQESLLIDFKNSRSEDFDSNVKITESKIERIEGIFYLRTFYNNGFVSTSLLKRENEENESEDIGGTLEYGKVTCTSSSCHSGSGCMPKLNGDCTDCNSGSKDCTRSASLPYLPGV